MKIALVVIAIIMFAFIILIIQLLTAKPTIKVDYTEEYNEVTKPANYEPEQNAAPLYQEAFELLS